ncbi:serine hydrolase [Sphingomicrobium lutaoense]|uniref:beta-lactamase n=1 Tax=Sphingomicrobium lutaoense TaxID=515949 RepID=A0A839Z534_9SPHN|nr:serine hydrolase [Sphingomicrobium lutaoense]MBB3764765.1 beta-lactamase class A [Sphingomicrobium lutaoense]
MTSLFQALLWGSSLIASSMASTSIGASEKELVKSSAPPASVTITLSQGITATDRAYAPMEQSADQAVQALNADILDRVRSFEGISGIAVKSIDDGWEAGWRPERLFPQQSVSKLWVALTAMDAVDKGQINLSKQVRLDRNDLTLWSRQTASAVLRGNYVKSLDELLYDALVMSDNHANDKLMREVGGPEAVRATIAAKGLGPIRFYEGERALQSKIAGLDWDPSYSIGNNFSAARARLPDTVRRAAFDRYIDDPYDGAAPIAIARALARLENGELLSPHSTAKLLTTMGMAKTGRLRVKAGLKPGWTWNHKTGTGQNYRGRVGGLNDIGILTAPNGKSYAIAVMTIPNSTDGSAQDLMRDIGRMVIEHHERHERGAYTL